MGRIDISGIVITDNVIEYTSKRGIFIGEGVCDFTAEDWRIQTLDESIEELKRSIADCKQRCQQWLDRNRRRYVLQP